MPVWSEMSVHGTCAVHRVPGFHCFLLFPNVYKCTSAVLRNLTFHTGLSIFVQQECTIFQGMLFTYFSSGACCQNISKGEILSDWVVFSSILLTDLFWNRVSFGGRNSGDGVKTPGVQVMGLYHNLCPVRLTVLAPQTEDFCH